MTLLPGDVCAYRAGPDAPPGFKALSLAECLAGLDPSYVHVGLLLSPTEEASSYTSGGVMISVKYRWPCDILRPTQNLDIARMTAFMRSVDGLPYGWWMLPWMGLRRRLGIRHAVSPPWGRPEAVCSSLVAITLRIGGLDAFPDLDAALVAPSDYVSAKGLLLADRWQP